MRGCDCGRGVADLMSALGSWSGGQHGGLLEGDVLSSGSIAD